MALLDNSKACCQKFQRHCSLKILELKGKLTIFIDDLKLFFVQEKLFINQ